MIFYLMIWVAFVWCAFAVMVSSLDIFIIYLLGLFKASEDTLRACVVEGKCPAGDSQLHIQREKLFWELMRQYGTFVNVFYTWCAGIVVVFVLPCLLLLKKIDKRMNTTFLDSLTEALLFVLLIFIALPLSIERTLETVKIVWKKGY